MRLRAFFIATMVALVALPAVASAQTPAPSATTSRVVPPPPPPPVPPTPAPTPPPAPKPPRGGKATIHAHGGLSTKKLRYAAHGQTLVFTSRIKPFVAGQVAVLELRRGKKVLGRKRAKIRRSKKGTGTVRFNIRMRDRGSLKLRIRHRATPRQRAFTSKTFKVHAGIFRAGAGAHGTNTLLLQRGLKRLGFAVGTTGTYDGGTERAVLAYRKSNKFARTGYASPTIFRLVFEGRGAFKARYPKSGRHVEFDWSRQVLALVDHGRAQRVYHASSGKPSTPTVFGTYSFYRKQPGTNSEGMVDSNYFIRGYAIHGYADVPNYAASHGCIRVPIPNAADIDSQLALGERIFVYH